ncbi:MAG TPA: 30S ribosomal protein S8 [Candidatus Megaira endosymbiont of Hartmannula sinica]|nr:30S ribosomal protein S8 [Candidatus Megaera endosymbiont of Hartmannula sinica]
MSTSDTISDMISSIKNGHKSKMVNVKIPCSKHKKDILEVLLSEGYINGYSSDESNRVITINLKYSSEGHPAIREIKRVSKPSKRVFIGAKKNEPYHYGMGTFILSTSVKGIVSDKKARELFVGGEVICKVF